MRHAGAAAPYDPAVSSVVVVIPSRGRPDRARVTLEAIAQTAVRVATKTILVVDADDPTLPGYRSMIDGQTNGQYRERPALVVLDGDETGDLVRATNTVSLRIARESPQSIIGNLGDDHVPRTVGWDRDVIGALAEPGIAYGDDGIHGEHLPSAPFISAAIVLALGWYALPTCRHLYIDDAWRELGRTLGRLHYLPSVRIEHMHPAVGKADSDAGYERANAPSTVLHDRRAFDRWMSRRGIVADADRVRSYLEAAS
jgi:hypothetical protein